MPSGHTCWVYYPDAGRWTWEAVGTYCSMAAAAGWLAYYLQRERKRRPGIDGVVLDFGVQPKGLAK